MAEHTPNERVTAGEPQQHGTSTSGHAGAASVFSDADWDAFRAEDFAAGKAVVALMLGIFGGGVILYSVVAYFIAY